MIFVFEDHEEDIISKFFRQAYPNDIADRFVYAKGNSNIKGIVNKLLSDTNDTIVVYLDTVPGNKETVKIYRDLQKISRREQFRLVVLPVVCMEYYLIKALYDSQVMIEHVGVDICLNKDLYFNSPLIATMEDNTFVKNFEKYCKLILIKNLKRCACHSGKMTEECYGAYYQNDCFCSYTDNACIEELLIKKIIRFIHQFEYIPKGNIISNEIEQNQIEIWDIHRELVYEYNKMVDYYINSGVVDISQFKKITEIQ